ncbi:homoserine dehydrogenase [Brevibacillus marinus]|uniref:homoserine dehydrogenase n=1 Tax=Brevibacillus marinus TaxID=2496837 RepID=UPI000F83CA5C|nr:homoserine dehydrogenase [Brevibacillus marinus]
MAHKLALIGFGVVGQGLAEILLQKSGELARQYGFAAEIVAISDIAKGSLYDPNGLDLATLLAVVRETGKLDSYPDTPTLRRGWDSFQTIRETNADTVVEVSFTDVQTGQPAIDHCKAAFASGKNVVMSNKGPVALAYRELAELARKHNVQWGFEGSVMSGTPTIRLPLTCLAGNEIREVKGILNGTCNFILTKMEEGMSYADALREAQRLGYAEADPTADVEGYDALYKIVIMANVVMGVPLSRDEVSRQGITQLTPADIAQAKAENKRWKLIARAKKEGGKVVASIAPEKLPLSDALAGVMGANNAITFDCDLAGPITVVGAGAGKTETGFALLIDLINIARGQI